MTTSTILLDPVDETDSEAATLPIVIDGWYPPIAPDLFRREHKIAADVTADRVREVLVAGIFAVVRDLGDWSRRHRAGGIATLAAVPSDLPRIDGQDPLVLLFRRAVFTQAKAELVERYRDMDITGAGTRGVETLGPSIGELRRDSVHAVRDILGVGRTTVELI